VELSLPVDHVRPRFPTGNLPPPSPQSSSPIRDRFGSLGRRRPSTAESKRPSTADSNIPLLNVRSEDTHWEIRPSVCSSPTSHGPDSTHPGTFNPPSPLEIALTTHEHVFKSVGYPPVIKQATMRGWIYYLLRCTTGEPCPLCQAVSELC